jgi:hypothetical protein
MNITQRCEPQAGRADAASAGSEGPLPWRSILLWNLLIVFWGAPLYFLGLIVHEVGHGLAASLVGLHAYGISFSFLTPIIESGENSFQTLVINTGGVVLATLSAVLVLPFCRRLRPSLVSLALALYGAGAVVHSALYITSGYYCQLGDFGDWKPEFPHMRFLMPWLVLCLPAVGYLLGGIYLPVQEAWLPAGSPARRSRISLLAPGTICLLFSLAAGWVRQTYFHPVLPSPYTFLIGAAFALLLFAGGVPRCWDQRPFLAPVEARRLSYQTFLPPLALGALLALTCHGDWVFPHRQTGTWAGARYADALVAQDENRFSLCGDGQGNVLWLAGKDQPIRSLSPDGQKTDIRVPGLSPLRIRAHRQLIYLLGERPQGRCLAAYNPRQNELTVLLDGLEEAGAFGVAPNGDLYFAKGENEVWLLPAGARQARRVWLAPQRISAIASGPSGIVCTALSDRGFGESGQIYALGTGGRKPRRIAANLSNPRALAVDGQDNIYVGGAGWTSLCLIPATNRNERLVLRGFGLVPGLARTPQGSLFYWPITGPEVNHELRVLRPKQPAS